MELPYNHDYKVTVSIGLISDRSEVINPATYGELSEAKWNAMSRADRKKWLDDVTREWAYNYIEYYWEDPTRGEEL